MASTPAIGAGGLVGFCGPSLELKEVQVAARCPGFLQQKQMCCSQTSSLAALSRRGMQGDVFVWGAVWAEEGEGIAEVLARGIRVLFVLEGFDSRG